MKIVEESSKIIQPLYEGVPPPTTNYVPLSSFDKVTYDAHIAIIYAYHPPNPTNLTLETGLRKALSVYREWAGRLGRDGNGEPIILTNDAGVRFVEATVDTELDEVMPLKPSPFCLSLHPGTEGAVEELVQVQITRFSCGSMVVGFTSHHSVADGHATSNFLVAWGQACRGMDIHPLPLNDRDVLFKPRDPPRVDYEHRGVEFKIRKPEKFHHSLEKYEDIEGIQLDRVHFSLGFLAKLKAKASYGNHNNNKPYSTVESLVAHLWRAVTKARGLSSYQKTHVKLSVNGRMRMNPRVPNEYFGNLVLWAFPATKAKDLMREPLAYGAKLVHDAIAEVNDKYFRSFIDFASYEVKEENLVPTADMYQCVECPNLEVSSWLRFPFCDLDFGGGSPYIFMPSYYPTEGTILLLPSFIGDGSIDVFISLFEDHLAAFKQICYELD